MSSGLMRWSLLLTAQCSHHLLIIDTCSLFRGINCYFLNNKSPIYMRLRGFKILQSFLVFHWNIGILWQFLWPLTSVDTCNEKLKERLSIYSHSEHKHKIKKKKKTRSIKPRLILFRKRLPIWVWLSCCVILHGG